MLASFQRLFTTLATTLRLPVEAVVFAYALMGLAVVLCAIAGS